MIHVIITGLPRAGKTSTKNLLDELGENRFSAPRQPYRCQVIEPQYLLNAVNKCQMQRKQHAVLLVIRKDRITGDINVLGRKEIRYLTNPSKPVILCITGCDTRIDLDWWEKNENFREFAKYGLTFRIERVVSGCSIDLTNVQEMLINDFRRMRLNFKALLTQTINRTAIVDADSIDAYEKEVSKSRGGSFFSCVESQTRGRSNAGPGLSKKSNKAKLVRETLVQPQIQRARKNSFFDHLLGKKTKSLTNK